MLLVQEVLRGKATDARMPQGEAGPASDDVAPRIPQTR
jgi:hypothetical protein